MLFDCPDPTNKRNPKRFRPSFLFCPVDSTGGSSHVGVDRIEVGEDNANVDIMAGGNSAGSMLILAAVLLLAGCPKGRLGAAARARPLATSLALVLALACGVARAQDVVTIGFASPLTGGQANYGKDNQNGAQMAIDDLNAQNVVIGGKPVKFRLQAEDDQAEPKLGPVIAQKFVDAKVAGVVGHFNSGVTIPASRVYNEAGIPELSVSTNVKYTHQGFRTAFRLMADDDKQGTALGEYAVKKLKYRRLAVIDDSTAYGQGLADAFEAAVKASGGQVVKREHTNDKAVDFNTLLTSVKGTNPDAVFFGGYDAQAGPMAKQMKVLGMNVPLMGGETVNSAKFIELAGPAAEGSIASTPGAALESRPGGKAFAARYKSRFNADVGLYSPYFYDGVMVIAAAMQAAGSTDPAKYLPALAKVRHPGITADIEFDGNGDLRKGLMTIFRVRNGKWEVVSD